MNKIDRIVAKLRLKEKEGEEEKQTGLHFFLVFEASVMARAPMLCMIRLLLWIQKDIWVLKARKGNRLNLSFFFSFFFF